MKTWKMALGTLALGALTVNPFIADTAFAGAEKKAVKGDKPPAPTASEIETGQLLIKDKPVAKSSTGGQPPAPTASEIETGQLLIKDRPVAKSSTGGQPPAPAPAPTASEIETGQLLIKDKPVAKSSTGDQPPAPTASEIETGQLLIKDKPVSAAPTGNDLCGLPYTPPCRSDAPNAKKASDTVKPELKGGSVIIALLASAAAIGLIVATSGRDDGPTSP